MRLAYRTRIIMKVKISAKDKTSLMSFKSRDLTWINVNNKPILKNPDWTFEDNNYNWKPSAKSQFIKIPLRQKITVNKASLELVNEIKIKYHFPGFTGIAYESKENTYVIGFFIFILLVTLFRTIDLSILAEQLSIIALYLLVTGITLKTKTLFKHKATSQVISSDL